MTTQGKLTRKIGRPTVKQSRVEDTPERPRRLYDGFRSVLSVTGLDPDYQYRWVLDEHETGQRILDLRERGWDFVHKSDELKVGESSVYNSENIGSIYRRSANKHGEFLYLMRILQEWYDEDQAVKQKLVDEKEKDMMRDTGKTPGTDDLYGSISIS